MKGVEECLGRGRGLGDCYFGKADTTRAGSPGSIPSAIRENVVGPCFQIRLSSKMGL